MANKEDTRIKRPKFRKRVHVMYLIMLLLVIGVASLYLSLPKIVEYYVVPELASKLNVSLCDLSIRQINYGAIDLADVTIASKNSDQRLYLSSVRLDYTLSMQGINVTKVVVSGVELDVELTADNQLKIAGRYINEWLNTITPKSTTPQPQKSKSSSWLTVESICLEYSQVNLKMVNDEWIVPIKATIAMPTAISQDMRVDFQVNHGRDYLSGNVSLNSSAQTGRLYVDSRLSISRYLSIIKPELNLPISGGVSSTLAVDFALSPLSFTGKMNFDQQSIRYDNKVNLTTPALLEFKGDERSATVVIKDSSVDYQDSFKLNVPQLSTQIEWQPALKVSAQLDSEFEVPTVSGALSSNLNLVTTPKLEVRGDYRLNLAGNSPSEELSGELFYGGDLAKLSLTSAEECKIPYKSNFGTLYLNQPHFEANLTNSDLGWQVRANGGVKQFSAHAFGRQLASESVTFSAQTSPQNPDLVALAELEVNDVTVSDFPVTIKQAKLSLPWNNLQGAEAPQRYEWQVITDKMLALHGGVTLTDGGYLLDGDMTSTLFVDNPTFKSSVILKPNLQLSANVEIVDQALNLEVVKEYLPKFKAWEVDGLVGVSLNYQYGLGHNSGDAVVRLKHFEVANDELNLTAKGINGEIKLPYLPKLFTGERVNISCDSVDYKEFEFSNLLLGFQISKDTLAIDEAGVDWLGGRIYTYAVRLYRGMSDIQTTVFCDNLSLSEFINTFGLGQAEGKGRIYGRIPVVLSQKGIYFKPGYLYSEPGVSDTIQIGNMVIPQNTGVAELDIATEAMKSFTYQWAKINFSSNENGEVVVASVFDGKPTDKLPFTIDPATGQLLRVDYQGANFQGINLTLRWKVPLNELIKLKNIYNLTKGKL